MFLNVKFYGFLNLDLSRELGNFLWIFVDLSLFTKHLFFSSLCKSSIPHGKNVDNVDNFVHNFILWGLGVGGSVDRMCMESGDVDNFCRALCNLTKTDFFRAFRTLIL